MKHITWLLFTQTDGGILGDDNNTSYTIVFFTLRTFYGYTTKWNIENEGIQLNLIK